MESHSAPTWTRSRVTRWLLVATLAIMIGEWAVIVGFATQVNPPHSLDFSVYYAAAMLLRHDPSGALYSANALVHTAHIYGGCPALITPEYIYPPMLAIVMEPLTLLPCIQALAIWTLISALLWLCAVMLMADLALERWPASRLGVWGLVIGCSIAFWPAYPGLFLGQTHTLMLLLLVGGIWLDRNGHPWLAGAAIVTAALIKPLPALLLLYYLLRGRWAVVGGAVVGGAALLGLMAAATSVATVEGYMSIALNATAARVDSIKNVALNPAFGRLSWAAMVVEVTIYLAVVILRRKGADGPGIAFTLGAMLVISPVVWAYYLIWLMPGFLLCVERISMEPRWRSWMYGALGAIFLLMATPFAIPALPYATLAFCAFSGALYWRSTEPVPAPPTSAAAVALT